MKLINAIKLLGRKRFINTQKKRTLQIEVFDYIILKIKLKTVESSSIWKRYFSLLPVPHRRSAMHLEE